MSNVFVSRPQPQGTKGGNVSFNYFVDRDPTQYDSKNYFLMDEWLNTLTNTPWKLVSLQGTNTSKGSLATWIKFGAGDLQSLTSNSGGVVNPDAAFNINVVGDGVTITGVGNPATHTITLSAMSTGTVESLTTDDGHIVTPTAGTIIIHGGTGIATTGTVGPNTVTVSTTGAVPLVFHTDNGDATPASNAITFNAVTQAGSSVTFSGSGHTVSLNTTDANSNTIIGLGAGNATISGTTNVGLGFDAGHALTSGAGNTLIGDASGLSITSGATNTALGKNSLNALTTGSSNISIGSSSGTNLTGAESNNLLINHAGITGQSNWIIMANGAGTRFINTDMVDNQFVGINTGNLTLTGVNNSAFGSGCLTALTNSSGNIALGNQIMTTATAASNFNTVIGSAAYNIGTGSNCTIIGGEGLKLATNGLANTTIGESCGFDSIGNTGITTGNHNCLFGYHAGGAYTSSESYNIIIGSENNGVVGESQVTRIGFGGSATTKCFIDGIAGITTTVADAVAVLVSASTGQLGTVSSSARYKENINDMGSASDDILNLRPVTFNYKNHSPESISYGLIAEEVAQVLPNLVVYDKDGQPETVQYHNLPVLLLNEIIKLKKEIEELKKR